MLKLVDILNISKNEYKNYKIHFAIGISNKKEPYELFLTNKFENWQSYQTNRNFGLDYVISLVYYEKDIWMFAGVYKVNGKPTSENLDGKKLWHYDLTLTDNQADLIGRLFVFYEKNFRASYPKLELKPTEGEFLYDMKALYLLKERVTISDFQGFENINITYSMLKYIVEKNISSWKSALSNVKGIYLIVDTTDGKQYVGSAYGTDCIWQRWKEYAKNGHGGNSELKKLLSTKNDDYKNNFKFSVLEVCNMNLGNNYIIERENYWKEVLLTRKFGLNKN